MESMKDNKSKKKTIKKIIKKKIRVHGKMYHNAKIIVLCSLTFVTIIALGIALSVKSVFKVGKIDISGESGYSYDEIAEISGIKEGDNLFACDTNKVKKNIESALPYVDNVEVRRSLPNKIVVSVGTVEPKFAFEHDGGYIVVSCSGKMFEIKEGKPENVIELRGVELKNYDLCEKIDYVEPLAKDKIGEIVESAEKNGFNVTKIDVSNLYNIVVGYNNSVDVLLGAPEEIDYKIMTAKEILCNKLNENDKGSLDLSSLKSDGRSYFTPEYIIK